MAAYASLVVVSKVIGQILLNDQHYSSICSKDQMVSLHEKVLCFQEFIEHVSYRPRSPDADELESRIRDVAYKLEDTVESIFIRSFSHEVVAEFARCLELVDLLLGESAEMRKKIFDKEVISGTSIYSHAKPTSSSSRGPPGVTNIYKVGLDQDLIRILDRIMGGHATREIIPITGMGGIGKTTLARGVYDYPGMKYHFDLVLWVTVSQEYYVKEILEELLPAIEEKKEEVWELILQVHKRLKGRRYLIVLDDVWDEKLWDGVRNAFPDDKNYSRVVLTTRLSNVASYVSSSCTQEHRMQLLNEEQSWDLLRETVYGHEAGCPGEFEDIGRTISRNCEGLPLALVVIGGILKFKRTVHFWEQIAQRTKEKEIANDESLLGVLSLSYTNLPPHLKACFLYLGSFPEDEEIPTKKLVRLWSAEGFLKPRESRSIEEVAEECLEELVDRSLVLVKRKCYNGRIKTSSIHDLVRDLCLRQARKEKFLQCYESSNIDNVTLQRIMTDQRRVSFPGQIRDLNISSDSLVRTVRTRASVFDDSVVLHLKLLRVLEKGSLQEDSALKTLSKRTNIRYLNVYLPSSMAFESVSKLSNLETLVVSGCLLILPVQIWEMPCLRHLDMYETVMLMPFPATDPKGSSVRSSSVETLSGVNFDFPPSIIEKLQNLKRLKIQYEESGDAKREYSLDNLVNLRLLEDLTVSREYRAPRVRNIGFPHKLKELRLIRTEFHWDHMVPIGKSLPHLEVLKLEMGAIRSKEWEPVAGEFLQLKYLKIKRLDLCEWRGDKTHFPSLEQLVIDECRYLKEVPVEIGEIDTLRKLVVRSNHFCKSHSSLVESVERIREEQESYVNDCLQIVILSMDQKLPWSVMT